MKLRLLLLAAICTSCSPNLESPVPKTSMERKMIGLMQKFDLWDENGDGYLDQPELARNLAGSQYSAHKVIAFYDTDGDGKISLEEAQNGYKRADEAETAIEP
jgi:Ca2+-binding EF-hand superfamily protein